VNSVAFSPDGRTLACAEDNNPVTLYEVGTGCVRRRLAGHEGSVTAVAFSPDGRLLVSAGEDLTALVWELVGQDAAGLTAEVGSLWEALAAPDPERAYRAVRSLAATPEKAVPFLASQLPPAPRAAGGLERLVAALDSESFEVRQKAFRELEALDVVAESALRQALKRPVTPEQGRRLKELLETITAPVPSGERLRAIRALEVLELAGTAVARRVLESLAQGAPEARLTQGARAALQRLSRRPPEPARR
jgi:hypothetical protein